MKNSEKYDQNFNKIKYNIQNLHATWWIGIPTRYKRVPKSLSSMWSRSEHNLL